MLPIQIRTGLLSLLLVSTSALAVDHAPSHDHHKPSAGLHLNQGQRWVTDAPLRQGMSGIREALIIAVHADTAHPLSAAEAGKLADAIRTQTDYLIANCVLTPKADAVLHVLLGQLLEGAEALRQNPANEAALHHIITALKDYPVYFNHEGWKPVTTATPAS